MNRRTFLRAANCSLIGTTSIFNTLMNLRLAGVAAAATAPAEDYKALVCLFFHGGNDSFNMLIPSTPGEYSIYQATRSNLALSLSGPGAALPIAPLNTGGRTFALHPSMPNLRSLFNSENAAFVANVGTLVQPTTKAQYVGGSARLPKNLYSHDDQIVQWQTAINQGQTNSSGWGGRMADLMLSGDATGKDFFGINLSGSSIFQIGRSVGSYPIAASGAPVLDNKNNTNPFFVRRNAALKSVMEQNYANLFDRVYARESKRSFDLEAQFNSAFTSATVNTAFPATDIASQLRAVARTIAGRSLLGRNRQTFFVLIGGFDLHAGLNAQHSALLGPVDGAIKAFWDAMVEHSLQDKVTLFTASDFARTLRSNGQGSDHAWGGNHFVIGGGVKGRRIYGNYPTALTLGGALDVGNTGLLLPGTSCDQYFAELALWFGVSPTDLPTVLPNIGNFYSTTSGSAPIGFLL